jgi:hypothetical protein
MKKIQHIVLLKFAPNKAYRMTDLMIALAELRRQMPGFLALSGGPYSSPEGLNQGFTHGVLMTFSDAGVRNQYLSHPDHETVKLSFLPDLEGVIAFDFEAD